MRVRKHRLGLGLNILSWLCILAGAGLLVVGGYIAWGQIKANHSTDKQVNHQVSNGGAAHPVSTEKPKPSEFDAYTVAPGLPRYLFIPKISVKAMIKPMALTQDGRIDVPKNAFDLGWYDDSAKPGAPGALLVDGHVSGGMVPGVFYNLKSLKKADTLVLERGDGARLTYRVVVVKEYNIDNVDMKAVLAPISSRPGLNLITCTGNVIKGTHDYDKRLVVFTEQI